MDFPAWRFSEAQKGVRRMRVPCMHASSKGGEEDARVRRVCTAWAPHVSCMHGLPRGSTGVEHVCGPWRCPVTAANAERSRTLLTATRRLTDFLKCECTVPAMSAACKKWNAAELEEAMQAAGLAATMCRTPSEWRSSEQVCVGPPAEPRPPPLCFHVKGLACITRVLPMWLAHVSEPHSLCGTPPAFVARPLMSHAQRP